MIVFIDTEVNPQTRKVADYGAVREDGAVLHTSYVITSAKVSYILAWKPQNSNIEYAVSLPNIVLSRQKK